VRPDFVAKCWNLSIPRAVKIIRQYIKPVDVRFDSFRVHELQVFVLSRKSNGYSVDLVQSLSKLRHKGDQVLRINGWVTAPALSARPLPVDIDTAELPFGQKLTKRLDEVMSILLCTRHLRPRPSSRTRVAELPAADTKVLRNPIWPRHKIVVYSFLVGVHLTNLVCLRVDGGESKDKVREACGVEVLWKLLIARCAARVPR
jgi:hypothetical protein